MNDRPRGLGRGLSALLGEPISTRYAPEAEPAPQPTPPPPFEPVTIGGAVVTPFPTPPSIPDIQEPAHLEAPQPPITPPAPSAAGEPVARLLPIDLVQRNPNQPRKSFDETELAELADSIRARGVLQPILVRPIIGGRFEIVAGERRWRAAQRVGLHVIPAVVRELNEVEILEIGIIENVQRADLNPLEEAHGYQALIERFGRTQQDIAEIVGKSRPHIANMLRLLGLPPQIQDMVREGRLTAGHARALLNAPNPLELAQLAIAQALNVREVERLAQKAKDDQHGPRVRPAGAGAAEKDSDTRALEESLSAALGLSVTIENKGEGGAVRIAYRTLEQLDEIAKRLSTG